MKRNHLFVLFFMMILSDCTPAPRPLKVGDDQCAHCRMTVSDARYGAEIVMPTGKVLTFDAVECLASYMLDKEVEAHSIWVVDYAQPGTLLPAHVAAYVHAEDLHSPMGMNLTAFSESGAQAVNGTWMDWDEMLAFVKQQGTHAHQMGDSMSSHTNHNLNH